MPRPDGSFYPKEERVAPVLERLVATHPEWINSEYAAAASKELNESVSGREVSALRGKIGLGWSKVRGLDELQFTTEDMKRAYRMGYEEGVQDARKSS